MTDLVPLLIPAVLILGALGLPLAQRLIPTRYHFVALSVILGAILIGIALNLRALPHDLILSTLTLPLMGSHSLALTFHWTVDLLSLLPLAIITIGWLALAILKDEEGFGSSSELLWLAALFPLVAATNILTLIVMLLFTDMATFIYFARRESATTARRNFVTNQLGTLTLIVVAILASADAFDLNTDKLAVSDVAGMIALLGIGIRLNLFPFHFGLPFNFWLKTERPLWNLLVPGAITLTVLARIVPWLTNPIAFLPWLYAWILVALAFAAIQAWRDDDPDTARVWAWQTLLAVTLGVPLLSGSDAHRALFTAFVASTFALVLLECARRVEFSFARLAANKIIYAWGIAMLASAPLTIAFFARVRLLTDAWSVGALSFVLFSALATAFALTPLAANWFALKSESEQRPSLRAGISLSLVALFALALSFTPSSLLGVFDPSLAPIAANTYTAVLRSNQMAQVSGILIALIAPLAVAFYLGYRWVSLRAQWGVLLERLISPLMFSEIFAFVTRGVEQLARVERMIYALVEHYPLGWIVFTAIGIALWLSLGH